MPDLVFGFWLRMGAAPVAQWWPSGSTLQFSFESSRYMVGGENRDAEDVFSFVRASEGWALDSDNVLQEFASGAPRVTTKGALIEEKRTNKCTNYNANPTDLTNISKGGDAAATLTLVDDSVELAKMGYQNICSSGLVFKLDNSAGVGQATLQPLGSTGNVDPSVISAVWRVVTSAGGARMQAINGGSGATIFITNPEYGRYEKALDVAASTASIRFTVEPGAILYMVLNQIENGEAASSPIVVEGAAATREADVLELTALARSAIDQLQGTFVAQTDSIPDSSTVSNRLLAFLNSSTPLSRGTQNRLDAWNGAVNLTTNLGESSTFNESVSSVAGYSASGRSLGANFGTVITDANLITTEVNGFDRIWIGSRLGTLNFLNGYMSELVYYSTRLSDTEIKQLSFFPGKSQAKSIHLLGDSFATQAQLDTIASAVNDDARVYTRDGVGGRTMANNALSYDGTPDYFGRILLIWDGSGDTEANTIAAVDDIASNITNLKWAYIEPDGASPDADVLAIKTHIENTYGPDHYISTLEFLQGNNDGSVNDLADVAAGLVPRSLRDDAIHLNETGQNLLADGPIRVWIMKYLPSDFTNEFTSEFK